MSIQLVTYANQTVTPTNDAIIYERAIDQNGIFYGCNVTVTSNTVNITGGYGIVCGREFVINSDSLTVTLAPSGTLQGRLYVRLDLADADAPIQLLTATGSTLPALVQDDDVNYTNGVYEMELATFTVGVSSLSDVVETFETIVGTIQGAEIVTLLWTNPTPTSSFSSQDVALPDGTYSAYDFIEVVYVSSVAADDPVIGQVVMDKTPCKSMSVAISIAYNNDWYIRHRARWWNGTGTKIHFDTAFYNSMTNTSAQGTNDATCVPYKIYGIKVIGGNV